MLDYSVLRKVLDKFILFYIDDIFIHLETPKENKQHLEIVLETLSEHELYANFNKCKFYEDKIQYLGHVISNDGTLMDPGNVKSILN